MGILFSLTLIFLSLSTTPQSIKSETQEIKSPKILDLVIRDYTFRSYNTNFTKTGKLNSIDLPPNLSGINVDTIKLRCGSLQRYGAKIKEFDLSSGVNVYPCIERVIIVRQNLGSKYSSIYYDSYELSGYQLVSPVLGLLAYNSGTKNFSAIQIKAGKKAIAVDFSRTNLINTKSGVIPLCASFDDDGKVVLSNQTRPNVCVATRDGHFGLVARSTLLALRGNVVSKWKIAIVSSIGGALGACLLSLLLIAMFVNAKKKARMDELERRAYEEEALQVSMVGHVRAVTASGTRTVPTIEQYECQHSYS
ncbi:hypothetical protein DH2020_049164 [Rehmannia glutinosa]|uniref:Transmembrane protein n=1 Tax=Rehmannia glutinosa TaxID=99300 RepID=A0ABR0U466_REHGL